MTVGMKRASCMLFVAVLAAMLVLPAIVPSAKTLDTSAKTSYKIQPVYDRPIYTGYRGDGRGGTKDEDEGDSDDLAGIKDLEGLFSVDRGLGWSLSAGNWWRYFWYYVRL
jgi:hypothetical protein